jgi:uncharacterized iron-regulated membrane protein
MIQFKNYTSQMRQVHRYVGIFAGLLLVGLGISGSILAIYPPPQPQVQFHQSIDGNMPTLTIADVWQISSDREPGLGIKSIDYPTEIRPYYRTHFQGKDPPEIAISSRNGEVASLSHPPEIFWREWVKHFHTDFLAGKFGKSALFAVGMMSIAICISGVWLWTGWRKWRLGWQIRWQAKGVIPYFDLHQVGGMVSVIFLVFLCLTGTILAAKPILKDFHGIGFFSMGKAMAAETMADFSPKRGEFDRWLVATNRVLPGGNIAKIDLPKSRKKVVRIHVKMPGEVLFANGRSWVDISVKTGEIVKVYDFSHTSWVDFARMSLEPLHTGHFNRTWAPWLYGIIGLMLAGLGITGFIIWYIKNHPVKRQKQNAKQASS